MNNEADNNVDNKKKIKWAVVCLLALVLLLVFVLLLHMKTISDMEKENNALRQQINIQNEKLSEIKDLTENLFETIYQNTESQIDAKEDYNSFIPKKNAANQELQNISLSKIISNGSLRRALSKYSSIETKQAQAVKEYMNASESVLQAVQDWIDQISPLLHEVVNTDEICLPETTRTTSETEPKTEEKSHTTEPTTAEIKLIPVSEPKSGEVLYGLNNGGSEITITASSGSSCVVLLKTIAGANRLSFYVRAGDTVTVSVPSGRFYVYFASGRTWYGYGEGKMFGENTSYSMDDQLCDFSEYTYTYTLYPVTDGNFSETPCEEDDFFE